jgi:acetamidase/formamidase
MEVREMFKSFIIFVALTGIAAAQVVKYTPGHDELKYTFGGHPAVLRLKPGSVLETWTEDCFDGSVKTPADLPSKVAPIGKDNPQTGPVYIEGAKPGDVLAVHILDLRPAKNYAVSSNYPGFGALTGTDYTAMLNTPLPEKVWWYNVDTATMTAATMLGDRKFTIPIVPFLGCIATAPQRGEVRWTVTPEAYGGNMDCQEVRKGNTLYLPVNVDGALLEFGDGHLAQGEGEIIGTALETSLYVTVKVDVIPSKQMSWPRLESDTHIMAVGCYRPLEDAFRIAYKELVLWLVDEYKMDALDAYELCSQAGEADVAQVVDPNYTVVAKINKKYLPEKQVMNGMHNKMRTTKN